MNDAPHDREEAIFEEALKFAPGAERAAYLTGACGGDPALRQRMEDLLAAHEQTANAVDRPPVPGANTILVAPVLAQPVEKPGDKIGHYKLLQQIGEGGCGVVYMAEQEQPVRRRVALKVIKPGMDTKQVLARFEAERQALAMMDNPNIARVFDGGATGNGRPFFVMELVKGVRITEYCDQNKLSTRDRLTLFTQVCQAIQHAHQKGIIHRDIKPSNILVADHDGVPVPKVIDFGIAKATTDQRLTDKTLFTAMEQFMGTPAYMSPEQAKMSGLDIDTRTDIYSLGVLLYELLTGKTPFDSQRLFEAGYDEIRRIIREEEPPRPSTRLSTMEHVEQTSTAKLRQSEAPKLQGIIRGDLDWIVMKALEKDRTRRYETANGLAADVQRHLNNEPVVARPPGNLYRFQKMVRRNKLAVAATAAVMFALLAGLAASIVFYEREAVAHREAVRAETRANENFKNAQKAVDDIVRLAESATSAQPGPNGRKPRSLNLLLADSAVTNYQSFYKQDPNEPDLQDKLAELYQAQAEIYAQQFDGKQRDFWGMTDDSEREKAAAELAAMEQVITNALRNSCDLLEDLARRFPSQAAYRDHLAAGYSALAQPSDAFPPAPALFEKALALRNGLIEEHPDDARQLRAKADLLAKLVTLQTNAEEIQFDTETELNLREQIKRLPNADRASVRDDLIKLANVYGRASDLPGDRAKSITDLRNANLAVEAAMVDMDTNVRDTNVFGILSLAWSQGKLARQLSESGNHAEATVWAQKTVQTMEFLNSRERIVNGVSYNYFTEGNLAKSYVDLGDITAAAGRNAAAETAYQRAVDSLEAVCRNNRHYGSIEKSSSIQHDAGIDLDTVWNKLILRSLDSSNYSAAVSIAAQAANFWANCEQERPGQWDDLLAASQWRLHDLYQLAGDTASAAHSLADLRATEKNWPERDPHKFVALATALAALLPPPDQTNRPAGALGPVYLEQALTALRTAEAQNHLAYPSNDFTGGDLDPLKPVPAFAEIQEQWRTRAQAVSTNTGDTEISVTDSQAILAAQANGKEITLQGRIASAQWTSSGRLLFISFAGVNYRDFVVVIRQLNRVPLEARLGGDLSTVLKPGDVFEFKGTPEFYAGHIQVAIDKIDQVIGVTAPAPVSTNVLAEANSELLNANGRPQDNAPGGNGGNQTAAAGRGTLPPGELSPANTGQLLQSTNKEVIVAGKLHGAEWSQGHSVIFVEFEDSPIDGFCGIIFLRDVPDFVAGLGGDPTDVLRGKTVELHGKIVNYHGRPEMYLSDPKQIVFRGK